MNKSQNKFDLIKFEDGDVTLDVNVSPNEETVWLTQKQMSILFDVSTDNISLHIKNIITDEELDSSTYEDFSVVQIEGKRKVTRIVKHYNLDMIIAVGYRVNSKKGTAFRKWANSILKQYLLKGYLINADRILAYQSNILQLEANYLNIENRLRSIEQVVYTPNNKILFEGEILEPYSFLIKLFFLAKERLIITDNYADQFLLNLLNDIQVPIIIYTSSKYIDSCDIKENITIIKTNKFHDRYIIVDNTTYTMGTSFNSIGKKRFTISKLTDIKADILFKDI